MKLLLNTLLTLLIGIPLIGLCIILMNSSGEIEPLKDAQGKVILHSIAEKTKIEIGGIPQGMFIRGENPENPVILFLHGGPGSPELPFSIPFEKEERLEKYFTVCHWDQPGAGMTFSSDTQPSNVTIDRMVEDTKEVCQYLMKRFGKEKIYLMGHSWGSYLGVKTIEKHPELFFAYIGIGQVTHQLQSERLAYDYMLQTATQTHDQKSIQALKEYNPMAPEFPSIPYLMNVRSPMMNKYHIGIMHRDFSMVELAKELLLLDGYTFSEKLNYLRGMRFSMQHTFRRVIDDNLFDSSVQFQLPVFVVHGKYDYQVSYCLAQAYINSIQAPSKALYTFENSAHFPNIEEPERFTRLIREIDLSIRE